MKTAKTAQNTKKISRDIIDYSAQEAPFEKWAQIKAEMDTVIHKPDPEPTDPLDELERVRLEGCEWVLAQKGEGK